MTSGLQLNADGTSTDVNSTNSPNSSTTANSFVNSGASASGVAEAAATEHIKEFIFTSISSSSGNSNSTNRINGRHLVAATEEVQKLEIKIPEVR